MKKNILFFDKCKLAVGLLIIVLLMVFILPASAAETKVEYKWRFGVPMAFWSSLVARIAK